LSPNSTSSSSSFIEAALSTSSGVDGIEWDAIEIPSLFFEKFFDVDWCLKLLSCHCTTGEPLPIETASKLREAKNHFAGYFYLRQLQFGYVDAMLHANYVPPPVDVSISLKKIENASVASSSDAAIKYEQSAQQLISMNRSIIESCSLFHPVAETSWKFLCGFLHIFSGGYAAGYYSYMYAEHFSSDAFLAFRSTASLEELQELGKKMRNTIFALGSSQSARDTYIQFRGRLPNIEALLEVNGLTSTTSSK